MACRMHAVLLSYCLTNLLFGRCFLFSSLFFHHGSYLELNVSIIFISQENAEVLRHMGVRYNIA